MGLKNSRLSLTDGYKSYGYEQFPPKLNNTEKNTVQKANPSKGDVVSIQTKDSFSDENKHIEIKTDNRLDDLQIKNQISVTEQFVEEKQPVLKNPANASKLPVLNQSTLDELDFEEKFEVDIYSQRGPGPAYPHPSPGHWPVRDKSTVKIDSNSWVQKIGPYSDILYCHALNGVKIINKKNYHYDHTHGYLFLFCLADLDISYSMKLFFCEDTNYSEYKKVQISHYPCIKLSNEDRYYKFNPALFLQILIKLSKKYDELFESTCEKCGIDACASCENKKNCIHRKFGINISSFNGKNFKKEYIIFILINMIENDKTAIEAFLKIRPSEMNAILSVLKSEFKTQSKLSASIKTAPIEFASIESAPVESVTLESMPLESVPIESVPIESIPIESVSIEPVLIESVPVESVKDC